MNKANLPWVLGLAASVLFVVGSVLVYAFARTPLKNVGAIVGKDGRPSSSKCQFFLWTGAFLFTFVAFFVARWVFEEVKPIGDIPQNVLIAMGLSITTLTAAKGITVNYVK